VPSWASPAELAAASSARSRHFVLVIAVRQNSSCLGRAAARYVDCFMPWTG
jgi:hypothetical protein